MHICILNTLCSRRSYETGIHVLHKEPDDALWFSGKPKTFTSLVHSCDELLSELLIRVVLRKIQLIEAT